MAPKGLMNQFRVVLAVAAALTTTYAQDREKQPGEGGRQGPGAHRNAAPAGDTAARPQRQAAPAPAAAPSAQAPATNRPNRTVGGSYNPPAGTPQSRPAATEPQQPRNAGGFNRQPSETQQPRTRDGYNPQSNTSQQPRNAGGFNRQPNDTQQPRSRDGYNPQTNTTQQPRNAGGFNRQPNDTQQPRNPGGYNPQTNTPQQPRNAGGFNRQPNDTQQPRNSGGYNPNINASRTPDQRYSPPRHEITRNASGRIESYRNRSGTEVRYRPDGRVGAIRSGNMTIQPGAGNSRRITVQRSDRTLIVTNRSGHGFVQRPFAYRGNDFVHRTYYLRGQAYSRYYRPYSWHGVQLHSYVPTRYFHPNVYSWFYRPWAAPVSFAWGWIGASWYGYYRGYFAPYPYYASPTYWLTDYLLSVRLAEDYADRQNPQPIYGAVPISPAVKQAIAMEVERQLAAERADADALARNEIPDPQAGFPRLLSDNNPHVFLVSYTLDVTEPNGASCTISRGDVIRLASPPPPNSAVAYLEVVASKPGGCRLGAQVAVGLEDLQDFENQMRESLAQGVDELRNRAGSNGLPALPAGYATPPRTASFLESAPPPDTQVASELQQEVQSANTLEQQATQEAQDAQREPASQPPTITLGQTTDQVIALLGNPKQIINLGTKQIYIYDRLKVTFLAGSVTDVE